LSLVGHRAPRWWTRVVPVCLAVAAAVAGLVAVAVAVLRPFPDLLPLRMLAWIAVAAGAFALAWAGRRAGRLRRVLTVLAVLVVVATSAVKANAFYGYRPTLATALGLPAANQVTLADLPRTAPVVVAPAGVATASIWKSPPDMPREGRIAQVEIPGVASQFPARPAWVYLPPAYLGSVRARLPVLVLIPGQPGGPEDWLLAGKLAETGDRFAAAHDGLAPVVVVPDSTGSSFGNPMCLDSRLGRTETYVATDVPAWIAAHLQVDPDQRAIGGFSFGGTCALQLAVRRPDVYPTFLDISGQSEPTLGDRTQTVQAAFGGDEAAFSRVDPLDELAAGRFPGSAGVLAVGRDDPDYRPQAEQVAAAARAAGMDVSLDELPGGHSWSMAVDALAGSLPWLSARTGLLDPATNRAPSAVSR
jgi:S-formylglutathione hydrolase FrmB